MCRVIFFFFNDTSTTEIYTLSLHDALPIWARLERHGWCVRDSRDVAGSPESYRGYIQRSRGEFSAAKPSCIAFQNAWVSDRTVCYLASGKPAVVQDTGASSYLPDGEGLLRFTSLEEAVDALAQINGAYLRHCRTAREIAETHFDAPRVLRSEEHTSELQSRLHLVCRLLLEKKKKPN